MTNRQDRRKKEGELQRGDLVEVFFADGSSTLGYYVARNRESYIVANETGPRGGLNNRHYYSRGEATLARRRAF